MDWLWAEPDQNLKVTQKARKKGTKHSQIKWEKEEWEIIWRAVVRNCKKILDLEEVPTSKYKLAREIVEVEPNLLNVNAVCTDG